MNMYFCSFYRHPKSFRLGRQGFYCFTSCYLTNISGKMYQTIMSLYAKTSSCVKLNGMYTDWFSTNTGVRQGDVISPTLFSIFINDLAIDIKTLDKGVLCGNNKLSILLYADDYRPSCRKREGFARHAKLYKKVSVKNGG